MKTKTTFLPLLALLAGTLVLNPYSALAERDGERQRDRQHHSRSDRHEQPKHAETRAPKTEQKRAPHRERQQPRLERKRTEQAERQAPRHVEQRRPQRFEHKRVEHQERREHRSAVQQHRYEHRQAADSRHRRHVETRRSYHVEQPRHVKRYSYRHVPRQRYYHGIHVHRRYGHLYPGFGFYYSDNDALQWIAFTVLTLAIIDHLDEHQQRMHEQAQIRATTADIGDTIYWRDRRSHGSVTVTDIWYERGRECRELEQRVTARGRTETSFGTVCQKRNGAWEVARLN